MYRMFFVHGLPVFVVLYILEKSVCISCGKVCAPMVFEC